MPRFSLPLPPLVPSLCQMREVLAAGMHLGVDLPQVEELRQEIKR